MSPLKPLCDTLDQMSFRHRVKARLSRLWSYVVKRPVITGSVLTSTHEVAGHPVIDDFVSHDEARIYVLKDTVSVYPLGTKRPPEQYLLRDERTGAFVVISRADFQTLFIER